MRLITFMTRQAYTNDKYSPCARIVGGWLKRAFIFIIELVNNAVSSNKRRTRT